MNLFEKNTNRETLTVGQRVGEVIIVGLLLLLLIFFAFHQLTQTGFFTAGFVPLAMLCLYGPLLLAMAAPLTRIVTGRRNPARPFEALANIALALGSLWVLLAFPFDYRHLADPLPYPFRFMIIWISNDVGRFFLILQVIISPIAAIAHLGKYFVESLSVQTQRQSALDGQTGLSLR